MFVLFPFLVAAMVGALFFATITFAMLHMFWPWPHDFFRVFAALAYLAYTSVIAALRTQARHWVCLLIALTFEIYRQGRD